MISTFGWFHGRNIYDFVVFQVLKKEFPKGVDIIYESVGGNMFDLCINALAIRGRLIVIGMISQVVFSYDLKIFK